MHGLRKFGCLLVGVVTVVAGLVPVGSIADEPSEHVVQVGATHPTNPESSFGYTRFYPDHLRVHQGDLVRWRWGAASYFGWHSVSFVARDMDVAAYPAGDPSAIPPFARLDEAPGSLAMDEQWVFGKAKGGKYGEAACGRGAWRSLAAQEPCVLDDTTQTVSSSLSDAFFNMPALPEPLSFSAVIDLPDGMYRYRCLIHPGMDGTVEVVPDEEILETPDALAEQRTRDIEADTEEAEELFDVLSDPGTAFDPATGVWTVRAGADTASGNVSIYSFLPSSIPARRGDTIHYIAGTKEPNTVTFTSQPVAGSFSARGECGAARCADGPGYGLGFVAFPFACEQDDPAGGSPAVFAWGPRPDNGCHVGDLEWLIGPHMADATPAPDNAVATPATFHNSGMVLDSSLPDGFKNDPRSGAPFPSTFDASFPNAGRFEFYCIAHPDFMFGAVDVT